MSKFITFSLFLLTIAIANLFGSGFTINGIPYNGMDVVVYPNTTNTFVIERPAGFIGRASIDSDNFSLGFQNHFLPYRQNSIPDTIFLVYHDETKLTVFITPKPGTPVSSRSKVSIFPFLTFNNQGETISFNVKLGVEPEINSLELLTSDLNDIKSGKAFRVKIKGSQLKEILLKLDDKISAKAIKNDGKEMIVEFKLSGKFNNFKLNQSSFGLLQDRVKFKFKAKEIFVK